MKLNEWKVTSQEEFCSDILAASMGNIKIYFKTLKMSSVFKRGVGESK
jgi:hypothetical protein